MPVSNPPSVQALKMFKLGKLLHIYLQSCWPKEQTEVKVKEDDVSGRADIVEADIVWDIKSVKIGEFWYICKPGYDVLENKKNHWLQTAYSAMKLNKSKCGLIFVSITKQDIPVKAFVSNTEFWRKRVEGELMALRDCWARSWLPPAVPRAYGGKECSYCNYFDTCSLEQMKGF